MRNNVPGVNGGVSKITRVLMFFHVVLILVGIFIVVQDVEKPGAGPVEKSFAASIPIQSLVNNVWELEIITMDPAVDQNQDSKKKTIVLVDIVVIVENDGKEQVITRQQHYE